MIRPVVADMILKIGSPKLRVRTGDVGGGFGMKIFVHPEYPMVVWASRTLKRTVKWIPDRQEAFQSDVQGRDHVSIAEMAIDKNARFLACRITTYAALGAYLNHFSVFIPTVAGSSMLVGLYQTPTAYVNVKGVMTNTVPTDAYRGAGRPEAAYLLERFVDHIARETGLTPDEIRARNFVKPGQIPWKTALGDTYDSGDFEGVMRKAMEKADWKGFATRRSASLAKGKWRGLGMATYVEKCGGGGMPETAVVKFNDDDTLTIFIGNQTNGQGQETAIRQIASARLGIDAERIRFVQGDSDVVPEGFTGGSRMVSVAGTATLGVADKIITKGKMVAASAMEAAPADIDYADGAFKIVGTDRTMSLFEVAKAARDPQHVPQGETAGLDDQFTRMPEVDTFPNGCHICELEVDPDTGTLEILNYSVVDDFGAALNPLLLQGDSDQLLAGGGTGGSRSMMNSGAAIVEASAKVIEQGRQIAAVALETAAADIEFVQGRFVVAGTDRAIGIMELADKIRAGLSLPPDVPRSLDVSHVSDGVPSAFPNGCHVAEVEIDPDTGITEVVRYSSVNDFGTVINPLMVEGQVHGGVVQGIGQALLEHTVYDGDGQLLSGSFMDYALPRAGNAPDFTVVSHPVPAKTNPLGVKGCGEAGCAGGLASVMNAVVDALSEYGIRHIDMPVTAEKVWRAIQAAQRT